MYFKLLQSHGAEIDEITVTPDLLERLDRSALTQADLETIERSSPLRPSRWSDYVHERHWEEAKKGTLWEEEFPCAMPLAIVDTRIMDLALSFWDAPDDKLLVGYRRLEDIVRERTRIGEHGAKCFPRPSTPTREN